MKKAAILSILVVFFIFGCSPQELGNSEELLTTEGTYQNEEVRVNTEPGSFHEAPDNIINEDKE